MTLDLFCSGGCSLVVARDLEEPQMAFRLYGYAVGGDVLWQAQLLQACARDSKHLFTWNTVSTSFSYNRVHGA